MKIDPETCIGCEACHPYCPIQAIAGLQDANQPLSCIDQHRCVECGVCLRSGVCPTDALYQPELEWPRQVRAAFSNPLAEHRGSHEMGRGTEEMKTNDVTGLFGYGVAGLAIEMGRPGVGTSFNDVQIMTMAVAGLGARFAPQNPLTSLMVDTATGELEKDILPERALSAIIEFSVELEALPQVLSAIQEATHQIDTVFSLDLINRVNEDGTIPALDLARKAGYNPRPNNKTNLGLGRPLIEES
jgi:Pyruvate/2-oxoacid:ferredoxin oxidoreductase delta subunit